MTCILFFPGSDYMMLYWWLALLLASDSSSIKWDQLQYLLSLGFSFVDSIEHIAFVFMWIKCDHI
jgi:hypothetical protein